MNKPSVAVITRTKDRPYFLKRALTSILDQAYNDYQIVIINDGGEPGPVDDLVRQQTADIRKKIRVVHNQKSIGRPAAINSGIKNSNSKYLTLLDDDDTWDKNFLKETVGFLETTDFKGVITGCDMLQEKAQGSTYKTISRGKFTPFVDFVTLFAMAGNNLFTVNSFVYDRLVLKKIGYYDESLPVLEDWDFNLRFIQNYDVGLINKPLAYYHKRLEESGFSGNTDLDLHINTTARILNKYLRQDINDQQLGFGYIANIANRLNNTLSKTAEQIVRTKESRDKLEEISLTLANIGDRITQLDNNLNHVNGKLDNSLEFKTRRYIKRAIKPLRK